MPDPQPLFVDARSLRRSGIGRYLAEILPALLNHPAFGPVTLLGPVREIEASLAEQDIDGRRVEVVPFPSGYYGAKHQLAWLRVARRLRASEGVLFLPHYDGPLFPVGVPIVVTVHDLTQYRVPGFAPRWKRAMGLAALRRTLRLSRFVVTDSRASAADLVGLVPELEDRLHIVPLGVSRAFLEGGRDHTAAASGGPCYLLCVGNRKRHKNMILAVEVLARLREEFPDLLLRVVGADDPAWESVAARIAELGLDGAVVTESGVSDARLAEVYLGSAMLLFPSLYEGFGLPPLEAMACGAPVVASTRASVPEVVGEAALLRDPDDLEGWCEAARILLRDPDARRRQVKLGRERATRFNWERTGTEIARILASARDGAVVSR
jgi:glycosyltransferase involved in cell wall biosynthesis